MLYYDADILTIWPINSCQKAINCICHWLRLFTVGTKMPAWDIEFIGCRAWLSCESSNLGAAGCWSNFTIQPWRGRHLQATWQTEKAAGTDFSQERKTFEILGRCWKSGFVHCRTQLSPNTLFQIWTFGRYICCRVGFLREEEGVFGGKVEVAGGILVQISKRTN